MLVQVKNVQFIDPANNCAYAVYAATDDEFNCIFPHPGQNVEFIEDLYNRLGDDAATKLLRPAWQRLQNKSEIRGLHGTIFCQLVDKKRYYPTKSEQDIIDALEVPTQIKESKI